ncbi:hypothetical protein TSOC111612_00865 [Tsukamurella ocularis]|uniref:replication-relaxation family protein n=1 Tax=Tsukamurella ocularis TaxID=1970234 RepID=UPI0039EF279D
MTSGPKRLAEQLSDRDLDVLVTLRTFRLATGDQVRRLHFADGSIVTQQRRTRSTLARLYRRGVVERLPRRIGGVRAGSAGFIYRLTGRGHRTIAHYLSEEPWRTPGIPGERFVRHTLAVTEMAVQLTAYAAHTTGVEQSTVIPEPTCWRRYHDRHGTTHILRPDVAATITTADFEYHWLIEVDLATEGRSTIKRKCEHHIAAYEHARRTGNTNVYPRVLWSVPDHQRCRQIETVIRRLPAPIRPLFTVATFTDTPPALCGIDTSSSNTRGGES